MCDTATLNLIDDAVAQKTRDREMFTAFDISLAVQENLKSQNQFDHNQHRHRHLKNDIHRSLNTAVASGAYSQSLQDVGAGTPAFVYYPAGGNPSSYVPLKRTDAPKAALTANASGPHSINVPMTSVIAVAALVNDNDGDGLDVDRKPDARGTICVPSFLLRSVGFNPGDMAYAVAGKDSKGNYLIVGPPNTDSVTTYTVDHSCNVRVTKSTLDYAGLNGQSYDFASDGDKVVVREHV
jgi:hypothetical protein